MATKNIGQYADPSLPLSDNDYIAGGQLNASGQGTDVKIKKKDLLLGMLGFAGTYAANVTYALGNVVYYSGSGYVCVATSVIGVIPGTNSAKWAILVSKGDAGALTAEYEAILNQAIATWNGAVDTTTQNVATATAQANVATNSANVAATSAASLQAALASFRAVYIGSLPSDPSADGNGNPLVEGAEYYNTTENKLRIWNGSAWVDYDSSVQTLTQNATLSAAAAANSATQAVNAAAAVASAESNVTNLANQTQTNADAAANSASTATAAAASAANSASAASGSAADAAAVVTTVQAAASEAATSASNADASATTASNNAAAASASALSAAGSATSASNSASTASAAASSVGDSATQAAASATSAANSASDAATAAATISQFRTVYNLSATAAGQSTYSVSGGYLIGLTDVYLNGFHLTDTVHYDALDGVNVVLKGSDVLATVTTGSQITISALTTYAVANAVPISSLAGSAGAGMVGFDASSVDQFFKFRNERVVDSIATLKTLSNAVYQRAHVTGYFAAGDGGGGSYYYDSADTTSTSNSGTVIVANDGGRWKLQQTGKVNARQFGVKADGTTDDTAALQAAVTYCFSKSLPLELPFGTIITSTPISYTATGTESIYLYGSGIGSTTILNTGFTAILAISGNVTTKSSITLRDFSIGRNNSASYTGSVGPKSLYVAYSINGTIERIEEFGAIGFGIQFDYSTNPKVVHCIAHDHKGGATGGSGTDGIHFYRCLNPTAHNNTVYLVGDDCISFGSYDTNNILTGAKATNNRCYNAGGSGVKLYGLILEAVVTNNNIDGTQAGGVQISDDYYNFNSGYGPSLTRIKISGNSISNVNGGTFNIGGVYLNSWVPTTVSSSTWLGIEITDNQIYGCNCGVGQRSAGGTSLLPTNLVISNNRIHKTTSGDGILLYQWYGKVTIVGNEIVDTYAGGIHFDLGSATSWTNASVTVENNNIDGYNTSNGSSIRGIWWRSSDLTVILSIRNNFIKNQTISTTATPVIGNAILTAATSPFSVIERNVTDNTGTININLSLASGVQGSDLAYSLPTAGTWYANQMIYNSTLTSGQPMFYRCITSGTFGTLNSGSTTGTTTDTTSYTLTVNDATGLFPGAVISIVGVTGTRTVRKINGLVLTLTSAPGAVVTGAAISFTAPTFKTSSNYA